MIRIRMGDHGWPGSLPGGR